MELESNIDREFVGESDSIKKVLDLALRVAADSDVNVVITGENGTGKEIIARIIHYGGARKKGNFVPVNSAAIPESLIESQFFGHKKGSFTDAKEDKKGFLEMASGGTLFLDEIGDMPVGLQAKLLRAIEERKIRKVGDCNEKPIDIRIISATNKNLEEMIEEKSFRMDLLHRINTIEVNIPPLRERPDDIYPLLRYFTKKAALRKNRPEPVISKEVIDKLRRYSFPGNVRELRNLVERAMILSSGNKLVSSDFPLKEKQNGNDLVNNSNLKLDDLEVIAIKEALHKTEYNQTLAAQLLGISRDALKRKIQKYSLNIQKKLPGN
jgi:transcriptional regulator with PAS, ATPase and Fis domain